MVATLWSCTILENAELWECKHKGKVKTERCRIREDCKCLPAINVCLLSCFSTCEVAEEVEGEGEAGGLRVEHGRLRMT